MGNRVYHDGDGSLGSLGLDKHDNEGLIQPDDLSQHGSLLGYVPSDPFAMDEPYLDSDSGAFSQEPPSPAQEGTESARSSFSKDAASPNDVAQSNKLQVGLFHKTRGGRNTFGAISADAMVRVTKGVGKRLQLRVIFSAAQQQLMKDAASNGPSVPFNRTHFSVTLEEVSLPGGVVVSEKPCDLDAVEVLKLADEPEAVEVMNDEATLLATQAEDFALGQPPVLLVVQCELKLFYLSKTLRFRVQYETPTATLSGHSFMFFTHDSGKSKKVAFGTAAAPSALDPMPASASTQLPSEPIHGYATQELGMDAHGAHYYPSTAHHLTHEEAWSDFLVSEPDSLASPSFSATSPFSPTYSEPQQASPYHQHASTSPSESDEHHAFGHMPAVDLLPAPATQTYFGQVHSDISHSAMHNTGSHVAQGPHTRSPPLQQAAQHVAQSSKSHSQGAKHHHQPRHIRTSPFQSSENDLEGSSSSSCSSSGLLTPSDSSTVMDTDSYSREFSNDHDHLCGIGATSTMETGSFEVSSSSASSFNSTPKPFSASASSSLSSDDGSQHMHAHMASRRSTKTRANKSSRPAASSSAPPLPFDAIDEQIAQQLGQRSASKKRKPDEMSSVPVKSEYPLVVDSSLDVRGVVRAQSFVQFSDIRFKTNVEDLTDALNIVSQLKGKKYEWKDSINGAPAAAGLTGGRKVIGLIAQEVKRVLPEVVVADKNGYLAVNYTDMVPVLIEALKQHVESSKLEKSELRESISELRAKVDELSQRSGDSLTDSSYLDDFSDDDLGESLEGSFQDDDLSLSDSFSHSHSKSRSGSIQYQTRLSRTSSISSSGGNDGDLTASSASLPEDIPLSDTNSNTPKLPLPGRDKPRKSRRNGSNATLPVTPGVTLIACMTHKRLAPGAQPSKDAPVVAQPTPIQATATAAAAPSAPVNNTPPTNTTPVSSPVAAPRKAQSANLNGSPKTPASTPVVATATPPVANSANATANSSAIAANAAVAAANKDKVDGSKKTATQRLSRSFTSLLHHIQTSTSNIMNSAANFTKGMSSSPPEDSPLSAAVEESSAPASSSASASASATPASSNLSSSSSSVGSNSSASSVVAAPAPSTATQPTTNPADIRPPAAQLSALSLASSTSEVKAQVLAPGFSRPANATALKHRAVHRAVVIAVSAWHLWSSADDDKLFLDETDARHSLVMTGKAVSQIESTFPECSIIHTVSVDMRGTVQSTVEDIMQDVQKRQVPAVNTTTKDKNGESPAPLSASVQAQLEQADLVWLIGHSQGAQVCVHICERLMRNGVLSSGEQLISILSLGGVHHSAAHSALSLHGNPTIYAGLHNFGNSRRHYKEYKQALSKVLEQGVPLTTVGAYQDSLVNMTSSSLEFVNHPNILRTLLVHHEFKEKFDPRHTFKKASNFTQELTRFALEMRNKNRTVDMLAFVNNGDTDVQETAAWIAHAKTFPPEKLHQLLFAPHVEFPATVPGFFYALGATMSMFNSRAFKFHKWTRQLREGIQRHREIPFAQDCYRVSLDWLLIRVNQGLPEAVIVSPPIPTPFSNTPEPRNGAKLPQQPGPMKRPKAGKREHSKSAGTAPVLPTHLPLVGLAPIFKENSNGFSFDFAEQVQAMSTSCSKAETARLQSAFRYWRPEGPKELLIQKLVTRSLGWTFSESPFAQYMDSISEIVGSEKDKEMAGLFVAPSSTSPPGSPPNTSVLSSGHVSPHSGKKETLEGAEI